MQANREQNAGKIYDLNIYRITKEISFLQDSEDPQDLPAIRRLGQEILARRERLFDKVKEHGRRDQDLDEAIVTAGLCLRFERMFIASPHRDEILDVLEKMLDMFPLDHDSGPEFQGWNEICLFAGINAMLKSKLPKDVVRSIEIQVGDCRNVETILLVFLDTFEELLEDDFDNSYMENGGDLSLDSLEKLMDLLRFVKAYKQEYLQQISYCRVPPKFSAKFQRIFTQEGFRQVG